MTGEEEASTWIKRSVPRKTPEASSDQNVGELNRAKLKNMEHIDVLEGAFASNLIDLLQKFASI